MPVPQLPTHPPRKPSEAIMHRQASGTYFVVKGSSTHSVQERPGEPIGSPFSSIHIAHCALFPTENSQAETGEEAGVTSSAQLPVTHLVFCPLFETSMIKINVTLWQEKPPFFSGWAELRFVSRHSVCPVLPLRAAVLPTDRSMPGLDLMSQSSSVGALTSQTSYTSFPREN